MDVGSLMTNSGSKFRALVTFGLGASVLLLAACGNNMEQRAATGAATGLIIAGPVGAAVGAAVGAVVNEVDEENR
jgi:osmotically inducible lipoprotein OsmB